MERDAIVKANWLQSSKTLVGTSGASGYCWDRARSNSTTREGQVPILTPWDGDCGAVRLRSGFTSPNCSLLSAPHPAWSLKRETLIPPPTPNQDELTSGGHQGCQMSPFSNPKCLLQGSLPEKSAIPACKQSIFIFFLLKLPQTLQLPLHTFSLYIMNQLAAAKYCWEFSPRLLQDWARCAWLLLREQRDNLHLKGHVMVSAAVHWHVTLASERQTRGNSDTINKSVSPGSNRPKYHSILLTFLHYVKL